MLRTRPAAVAGLFYPARADELRSQVDSLLDAADAESDGPAPKALIAPHAGYEYSGPVAASAYAQLAPLRDLVRRVVLLGPSHRVALTGVALSSADAFATPLGTVPVDVEARDRIGSLPWVVTLDAAHAKEHGLEVHLPFLQQVLHDFAIVPLVVGETSPLQVAQILDRLWDGPGTLIVVSSDLSHYLDYANAREHDAATSAAIESLDEAGIAPYDACGAYPLAGLLLTARVRGMRVRTLDLRNSGDTAGGRDEVVGYGAWALYERAATGEDPA